MSKLYLFVYNDDVGTQEQLTKILDSMHTVKTWRYDLPHVFYIISDHSAPELSKEFESKVKNSGRFMFIEATGNAQGQMLLDTWFLINNKYNCPPTGN